MTTRRSHAISAAALLLLTGFLAAAQTTAPLTFEKSGKPRVIVLTDITNEPDDEESMVRFLVYANEFDVEGLIATTSTHLRNRVAPEQILVRIDAYEKVYGNLSRHAEGYPQADALRRVVKTGPAVYGMEGVGPGKLSDGARLIIEAGDKHDPRPLWISIWGGANTLAQALGEVRDKRSAAELERFVSKLRVYAISDQDDAGRWLRLEFPGLFYVVSPSAVRAAEYHRSTWSGISGDRFYRNGPGHKWHLVSNEWLEENVRRNHGPLGELYPPWTYIMEGDTPSFLGLINNGLGSAVSPAWGGWGGRYTLTQSYAETRPIWTNSRDSRDEVIADDYRTYVSDQATIWRWREAYQHDFAARMDWCVTADRRQANHNPVVVLEGDRSKDVGRLTVVSGAKVAFSAQGTSDPDGNQLTFRWWMYPEAGTYRGPALFEAANSERLAFTAPVVKAPADIHIICEVRDNGSPNLFAYRRVIVTVQPQ